MNIKKLYNKKSFVLITTLLITSILIIITIPYVSRVVTEYKLMAKIYNATAALDLAEGGIDAALWEIAHNNSSFTGWSSTTDLSGNKTYSVTVSSFQTSDGTVIGDYSVTATVSADGMSAVVIGTGYVPNQTSPDEVRIVKVVYTRNNFSKAVLALNGISMSGQAKTDSYDSSLGSYDSQTHTQQGDIATNGAITLSGQAYVNGDANPGPDYPFTGTPPVSGSYATLDAPFTVEPIPPSILEAARLNNDNDNIIHGSQDPLVGYAFSASSSEPVTLPGGTYYFTSINISGQAVINVTGSATIFVDGGNITISGQGIINDGQPRDLLIYSTGSSINISGQAALAGALYAPTATVTLTGQEDFYGAIVCGQNVDSGQAAIHYDMDLLDVMPVFANNRVTSWQELKQ